MFSTPKTQPSKSGSCLTLCLQSLREGVKKTHIDFASLTLFLKMGYVCPIHLHSSLRLTAPLPHLGLAEALEGLEMLFWVYNGYVLKLKNMKRKLKQKLLTYGLQQP